MSISVRSRQIGELFAAAWSAPDSSKWSTIFTSDATYADHAFLVRRSGTRNLVDHWNLWRTSNPNFVMKVVDVWPGEYIESRDGKQRYRCSVRTTNEGRFEKDLPNKKASGKQFWFIGVIDFVVVEGAEPTGKDDLIQQVDEWYCSNFDVISPEKTLEGYHTRGEKEATVTKRHGMI